MKIWVGLGLISILLIAAFVAVPFLYDTDDGGNGDEMVRYVTISSKIRGLDPQDIGDTTSSNVGGGIFETLYTYHYLKRPYELIPLLAEDLPQISEDRLTWTIRIKKGVLFADDEAFPGGKGRELVAEDFVYAWKRIADLNNRSSNYASIFEGYITGLDEFRAYTAANNNVDYNQKVEGIQTVGKYTLQIKLKKPHNFLLYWLAHLPTAPVARGVVEKYGKEVVNHPVGTGPYRLVGNFRGSSFTMVRNKNFREMYYPSEGEEGDGEAGYLDDAGKRIPFIDRVEWSIIEEDQPYWLMFITGQSDSASIPKDNFQKAIGPNRELTPEFETKGIRLVKFMDPSVFYYGFNMDDEVMGRNKPLRQAMSLAFNREIYIERFLNGRGQIPVGPIPPMMAGHRPEKKNPYTQFDLDKARKLLAEAKKIQGGEIPGMKLAMPGTDTTFRQMGEFFKVQMKRVGLTVDVDYMTWPRFQDATKTRSHQIFALGWIADYPDAESFLLLTYSKNKAPGPNSTNYSDPKYDELYEKAVSLPDVKDRVPLYYRMEDLVIEDCPWILTLYREAYVLHYEWLKNFKPNDFVLGTLKYQRVDMDQREKYLGKRR